MGTVSGQRFNTRDGAATAAEKIALRLTANKNIDPKTGKTVTDWEFGGWIVKDSNGKYGYTLPLQGAKRGEMDVDDIAIPKGFTKAADYHTHPDPGSWGEGFSPGDMNRIDNFTGMRGYVGMVFSGNVRRFDPGDKDNGFGVSGALVTHVDY